MQSSSVKDELLILHKTKGSITIQKRPARLRSWFSFIEKTDTIIENSIAVRYWQGAVNYLRRSYIIEIKLDKHDYQYINNRKRTAIGEMNFNQINTIPLNYSTLIL